MPAAGRRSAQRPGIFRTGCPGRGAGAGPGAACRRGPWSGSHHPANPLHGNAERRFAGRRPGRTGRGAGTLPAQSTRSLGRRSLRRRRPRPGVPGGQSGLHRAAAGTGRVPGRPVGMVSRRRMGRRPPAQRRLALAIPTRGLAPTAVGRRQARKQKRPGAIAPRRSA